MRVHELRTILDHLPDDMEVHVASVHATHVGVVEKRPRSTNTFGSAGRYPLGHAVPPAVVLRGTTPWHQAEPRFELRGRWPRADELARKLDPDVPEGAA